MSQHRIQKFLNRVMPASLAISQAILRVPNAQRDIPRALGVTYQTVSNWIDGKSAPSAAPAFRRPRGCGSGTGRPAPSWHTNICRSKRLTKPTSKHRKHVFRRNWISSVNSRHGNVSMTLRLLIVRHRNALWQRLLTLWRTWRAIKRLERHVRAARGTIDGR